MRVLSRGRGRALAYRSAPHHWEPRAGDAAGQTARAQPAPPCHPHAARKRSWLRGTRRASCSSRPAMQELSSHVAKAINTAISSSWAIFVAATVALFLFFYGDSIGLDRQRVDLHSLVDAATFLMVFVIEHTQS